MYINIVVTLPTYYNWPHKQKQNNSKANHNFIFKLDNKVICLNFEFIIFLCYKNFILSIVLFVKFADSINIQFQSIMSI